MDEKRLQDIERYLRGEHPSLVWRPEELIAAVRVAWQERDTLIKTQVNERLWGTKQAQRADRAEAEVERLQEELLKAAAVVQAGSDARAYVQEFEAERQRLRVVREAAEACWPHIEGSFVPLDERWEEGRVLLALRRALDAAKS